MKEKVLGFFSIHKKEASDSKELWPIWYYIVAAAETIFLLLWGIFHQQPEQKYIKEQGEITAFQN